MVLGLHFGKGKTDYNSKKIRTYEMSVEFMKAFTEKHGSVNCLELLDGLHMARTSLYEYFCLHRCKGNFHSVRSVKNNCRNRS
jgi:hypothetical protein